MTPPSDDAGEIEAVVRSHGENFVKRDVDAQLAIWDSSYPMLSLLPTEREKHLRSWAEIKDYYTTVMPYFGTKRWDIRSFKLDFLTPDVAFAIVVVEGEAEGSLEDLYPSSGDNSAYWLGRVTYYLHRTPQGWKIIHCEDSTLDLFRAYQLWERQKGIASAAVETLRSLVSPAGSA
jgi:ketosteroid isomerase-like protein